MTYVQPTAPRHTFQHTDEGVSLCMPSPASIAIRLLVPLWLCGWTVGEISAIRDLLDLGATGRPDGFFLFVLFWLLGWTAAGLSAAYGLVWQIRGQEIVNVSAASLSIRREIRGLVGRTWAYDLAQMRRLRLDPSYSRRHRGGGRTCRSTLAFDYGAKTVRFGTEVDEAAAAMILQRLVEISPSLRQHRLPRV